MDIHTTTRRANLERLIQEFGSLEAVAALVDSSSVYLSQIRNQAPDSKNGRPRGMGPKMARKLELAAKKPQGWMDTPEFNELVIGVGEVTPPPYFAPEVSVFSDLASVLKTVPRTLRTEVATRLSALALAPDSAEVLEDLTELLRSSHVEQSRKQSAA